jgi:ribulose-5-phosphate 4-epimerase/fuculose-1-phosphate aldolase
MSPMGKDAQVSPEPGMARGDAMSGAGGRDGGMSLAERKALVAQAVRTLAGGDILTLTVGHVSSRVPGEGWVLILGHTHKAFKTLDSIEAADIIAMDLAGNPVEPGGEPPGERFLHTEIYRRRPDVQAIVHGHPETSTYFGVAGREIVPVYFRAGQFAPRVAIHDFAGQIDTPERGRAVAEALGGSAALLLAGHGTVVVGASVEEAVVNAFALETNARIQLYAALLGTPRRLREEEIKAHKNTSVWRYYVKRYDPRFGED